MKLYKKKILNVNVGKCLLVSLITFVIRYFYAIKINKIAFNKIKGRTVSITLGNRKKDIVIWNDYYEIKM